MKRLCPLENNSIHHVYSKSIYRFQIFTCDEEYRRMLELIQYYQYSGHSMSFSQFIKKMGKSHDHFTNKLTDTCKHKPQLVNILAYCLMPTHVHFILEQIVEKGIETFMGRALNAYTKYFNFRHNRRGPLWENRFGNRLISDQEGLNRCFLYVHNNPVKENLAKSPEQWKYSSAYLHNPGG